MTRQMLATMIQYAKLFSLLLMDSSMCLGGGGGGPSFLRFSFPFGDDPHKWIVLLIDDWSIFCASVKRCVEFSAADEFLRGTMESSMISRCFFLGGFFVMLSGTASSFVERYSS